MKNIEKKLRKKTLSSLMVDHHYPIETAMVCPLYPITPLITAPPNWVIPDLTEGCGKGAAPCLEVWSQRQLKEIWESGLKTIENLG
jgi:hypothetical protein